jgi:glutathione S-transferase
MDEIVLYGILGSPFVRTVQMMLAEKQAPHRVDPMAPGTLRSAEHLARHPFGRVPAIDHGDFRLYETQAILRYLDAAFPNPPMQPTDPRTIGRMNQIIGINDWYLFQKVGAVIVFNRIIGPRLMNITPDEAAIEAAMPTARICVTELEGFLADQAFLAGDSLTLADLMVAPQLDFLHATAEGQGLLAGTRLADWLGRMNQRDSMQRSQRPAAFN